MSFSSAQQINTRPNYYLSQTVSVIIPAYNEAAGIAKIIDVIRNTAFVSEIIVVDDGSHDQTGRVALNAAQDDPRVKVITHPVNLGKGKAIFSGARACKNSIVVMVDADLTGLKPEHFNRLIKPVMESRVDMTLGIFRGGKLASDFSHWATPWLTGQRCFRRELLRYVNRDAAEGYGFETALTMAAKQRNWQCEQIYWRGVSHPPSEFHRGKYQGIMTRARIYSHILRAWYIATSYRWVGKYLKNPL
ncbi:MAG: glycosyltransferase family 2 protein [Anaerolineales bacterium]|nr:glycosyltransferase family 2 protein [Anaerolineales bacterium]